MDDESWRDLHTRELQRRQEQDRKRRAYLEGAIAIARVEGYENGYNAEYDPLYHGYDSETPDPYIYNTDTSGGRTNPPTSDFFSSESDDSCGEPPRCRGAGCNEYCKYKQLPNKYHKYCQECIDRQSRLLQDFDAEDMADLDREDDGTGWKSHG